MSLTADERMFAHNPDTYPEWVAAEARAKRAAATAELDSLPHAVYRMYATDETLLYVGCTARLGSRLQAHDSTTRLLHMASTVKIEWHPDRAAGRAAELRTIRAERPMHNSQDKPRNA